VSPAAAPAAPATGYPVRRSTDGSVDETRLFAALDGVEDPELPLSIVELGLLREVEVTAGHVRVGITYTSLACPCVDMLREDVRDAVAALPDVTSVQVDDVLEPWSRDDVTPEGIQLLRTVAVL
jgi:metal-sulfur cluster biosynthetic enzyme